MRRTLEPQDRISRYSVVGPLGAGGMGEVYVAKDESLERNVALKVLPPSLVRNEERVRRFIIEAKSASSLNHPNIVTIYEIGQDRVRVAGASADPDPHSEPVHFISMELVSGESLAQKIHEEKSDLRTLLGWLAQAAEGIAKAHAAGIVHRDLKPGNIMISKDGFAKVLDFGLAKLTEKHGDSLPTDATSAPTELPATGVGAIMGTVGYMSPEQVQGRPVDPRSDIFSLGCVIYEAATRRRPFVAESDIEIMHRILRDRPTPVEELNPRVPAEVRRILRRCLAKSPDERFQSMKDLALELREAHDDFETLPVSGSSGASMITGALGAPPRSRRGLVAGIAVAALILAGGLIGAAVLLGKRAPGGGAAVAAQDMKLSVLMSRDDIQEFVISTDGRYVAYVAGDEDTTSLNVRQVRSGGDVRILPPQEYPIHGVSFSPDGDYLFYLNQDPALPNYQALFQVASLGGTPRKVFFDVDTAAAVSPDGARVCFRRGEPNAKADTLVIGDLATGKDKLLVRVSFPQGFASAPDWSPDGRRVAVAHRNLRDGFRTTVTVYEVESGRGEQVGSQPFTFADSIAWLPDGKALIVTAIVGGAPAGQIYRVSYPDGETHRLTNDLSGYTGLSYASTGRSIAAMRTTGVSNIWSVEATGSKEAHPVTKASGASGSATEAVPLPGGDVAFMVAEGDSVNPWRAKADGSEPRRLASVGGIGFGARYADGAGFLFTVFAQDAIPHVWRMDADGGGLRQVTRGNGEFFQEISPDGKTALFAKLDDPSLIWSLDLTSNAEPRRLPVETAGDRPAFSPDGALLLYTEFVTIEGRLRIQHVVVPSKGGEPVARVLLPPSAVVPFLARDGKAIDYVDRNEGWNVMRQPFAGGKPAPVTRFTEGVTTQAEWSPDGTYLAVVRRIGPNGGLWIVQPGHGDPKLVAQFRTGAITECRFSPDSKTVFFTWGTSSKDVVLISEFQ